MQLKQMNTPNKLTILRIMLVPVFMCILLLESKFTEWSTVTRAIAGVVFLAAAITDAIDGNMARKYNLITNFGKFLDPLADKMLVSAALICFVARRMMICGTWVTVIILAREFMVTSLRLLANTDDGIVIAASKAGKLKTVFQMTAITAFLFQDAVGAMFGMENGLRLWGISLADVIMWVALVLTVYSGAQYLKNYSRYINFNN